MLQRLQGKDFAAVKHEYKLKTFIVTDDGNVKAYLQHKVTGWRITHWLNDEEKKRFLASDYIKECYRKKKPLEDGVTYRYGKPNSGSIQGYDLSIKFDSNLIKIHGGK